MEIAALFQAKCLQRVLSPTVSLSPISMAELIAVESLLPLRSISSITPWMSPPGRPWKSIADGSERHVFASVRYSPVLLRFIWLRSWTLRYRNPIKKLVLCCSFIATAFSLVFVNGPKAQQRHTERTLLGVGASQSFEHVPTTEATAVTLVWSVSWAIFNWTDTCHQTVKQNTMLFFLFGLRMEEVADALHRKSIFFSSPIKINPDILWKFRVQFLPFEFY